MTVVQERPYWTTSVSDVTDEDVHIRGYSLRELIGKMPFSAASLLLIRGKMPTPQESKMMESILCSVLDYSLQKPGTAAARYCVSSNPQMAAGLATAVLSVGEYSLSPADAGRFIRETFSDWKASGDSAEEHASKVVDKVRSEKRRIPGFGHPVFREVDPRAEILKNTAKEQNVWGELCELYEIVHGEFKAVTGKDGIVINDVGMMAAIMAQMGLTPEEMEGVAVMSTIPGVIAHISEELKSNVRIRTIPDSIAEYARERYDLDSDMAAAGWPTGS